MFIIDHCNVMIIFPIRGINYVLSALVFNVVPTIFEVSLVTGIMVTIDILHGNYRYAMCTRDWQQIIINI